MKRRLLLPLLLFVMVPVALAQNYGVNTARGFNVNGVYQMNGIDSINTYNGNLTLGIPIGQAYSIGGGLSYQLRLFYNGSIWESEEKDHCETDEETGDPICHPEGPFMYAYPHRGANAGIGWMLSLGRLYEPDQPPNNSGEWMYESPDGALHHFFQRLHNDGTETGFAWGEGGYTRDGTYLRMRELTNGSRVVEFPSGEVHTFTETAVGSGVWRLSSISNQYSANNLSVTYPSASQWVLSDGFRTHTVNFVARTWTEDVAATRPLVDSVVLKTFGTTTATYKLEYTQATLWRPPAPKHTYPADLALLHVAVQLLSKIVLPDDTPDNTADNRSYTFSDDEGRVDEMILPTGGKIQWSWDGDYAFPRNGGGTHEIGISSRRLYDIGSTSPIAEWTYESTFDLPASLEGSKELKNTVTDPLGNKTEYYFSVATTNTGDWKANEYGLPITKSTASGTRWLSQRFISGTQTLRSTYLRYEHDTPPSISTSLDDLNRRIVSTRVVHDDDVVSGEARYVDTENSDFDGLGHYRTATTSSNIADTPTRIATRNFNSAAGTYPGNFTMIGSSSAWLTETYASSTVEEGDRVLRAEFCFDGTGFLTRSRALRDVQRLSNGIPVTIAAARSSKDVISIFDPDTRGNVEFEESYGGDSGNVTTGALCGSSIALGTRSHRIDHVHPMPGSATAKSTFSGLSYSHRDITVDLSTGLPATSRDESGVVSTYQYDNQGRLTRVFPVNRATTKYVYSAGNPAEVTVTQHSPGTEEDPQVLPLTKIRSFFDGLGRLGTEWTTMPNGSESRRERRYDKVGQTISVSELGTAATLPATAITYDPLGRTETITSPDGKVTEFDYVGARSKTRKASIWTGADTSVSTTETYDGFGRLISVAEKSGPTSAVNPIGAVVTTSYKYDPASRLLSVLMKRSTTDVQQRLFDHDGRGFLRWQSHPESGVTSFEYDARGLVVSRTQGAADTLFDLRYSYDSAGRLRTVKGKNPFYVAGSNPADTLDGEFRMIKELEYGAGPRVIDEEGRPVLTSLETGKLVSATRFNYAPDPLNGVSDIFRVTDAYEYTDTVGRMTRRTTTIDKLVKQGPDYETYPVKEIDTDVTYDVLDRQDVLTYPLCFNCGVPATLPARNLTTSYSNGRVTGLSDFVSSITYSANGMRNVLSHTNGIADTQTTSGMARPASIRFASYDNCLPTTITAHPSGDSYEPGDTITLSVTATGAGLVYQWNSLEGGELVGETSSTYTVPHLTQSEEFWVVVTGACGTVTSQSAVVTVASCTAPTTGEISAVKLPDGWKLQGDPTYRRSTGFPTFAWRRVSDNALVGSTETLTIGALTTTTTYSLTVTDACGSETSNVTISVAPVMPRTLTATRSGPAQITVTWPAVSGVSSYSVERRSGTTWAEIGTGSGTTYFDGSVATGRTYAYRVSAADTTSGYTNSDIATIATFTRAVAGEVVDSDPIEGALAAVNKVRAAAGWPSLTWQNILSTTDPLPAPGVVVSARHITACRARMNEALQALGVIVLAYPDADVSALPIEAEHINEIQDRVN